LQTCYSKRSAMYVRTACAGVGGYYKTWLLVGWLPAAHVSNTKNNWMYSEGDKQLCMARVYLK
jgi:hypothetical protein